MTVVDVGANHGWYTLMASHLVGSAGTVVAVEPDARALNILKRTLAVNSCSDNVIVVERAVGDQTGVREFVQAPSSAVSHLRRNHESAVTTVLVEVESLDSILEKHGVAAVDIVKIDVEGAELEVLCGMRRILSHCLPIILAEGRSHVGSQLGRRMMDIPEFLGLGYECKWVCERHDCLEPLDSACVGESGWNLLCLPRVGG